MPWSYAGSETGPRTAAELNRRNFLALSGSVVGIAGVAGCGWFSDDGVSEVVIDGPSTYLAGGYPRMLAFRQSEAQANLRTYAEWEPVFAQFNGIIGKALREERTDNVGPRTVEYFTRFKRAYPGKLVLLHLNGRARLPTFETEGWSAGWWLYRAGTVLTSTLEQDETRLRVASTKRFKLRPDVYGGVGDDIVIAAMGPDGRPDFTEAEQVRLSGIDEENSTLSVVRGKYGTSPRSFRSGAYLAPHEYAGPWSPTDDRVWLYNLTTLCPPDPDGRRVVDALLEQVGSWFGPDGELAAFDGLELDVFQFRLEQRDGIDADCDGKVDLAMRGGVDTYLEGQVELTTGLRQILGTGRYLIVDGGVGQSPDSASVNGIELEGFPTMDDYGVTLWSQAVMALEDWRGRGVASQLSYPLYKFAEPNDYPVSFNRFRLALAAALATNCPMSWFNDIGGSRGGRPNAVVIWDELIAGTAREPGWLGAVRGETLHMAEAEPDLLAGAGDTWSSALIESLSGNAVGFEVASPNNPVLVVSRSAPAPELSFSITGLALDGPDVVLAVDLLAEPRSAYPETVGRRCTVAVTGAGGELAQLVSVGPTFLHTVLGFHGVGPGPIDVTLSIEGDEPLKLRGLRMFAAPDAIAREFAKGAVFANPSATDFRFDVAALFGGREFRRIQGSEDQDPSVNDGSLVGATVTLALDALVVRAA